MVRRRDLHPRVRRRLEFAIVLVFAILFGLCVRLWDLQIVHFERFADAADHNRIRLRRVDATRGRIVDRHGRVLVDSRASFDAVIVPEDAGNLETTLETLAQLLGQSAAETHAVLERVTARLPFEEVVVKRDLTRDEVVALETHRWELPGVRLRVSPRRRYVHGPLLAHVLGYVGEAAPADLGAGSRYRAGDLLGKTGVERVWEAELRGVNGGRRVEVDAMGRELRVLGEVPPLTGNTLVLTIDLDLQKAAEDALGDRAGAIVAIDPRNGEVLAMASHPAFDPNDFASGISAARWKQLLEDPLHPLTHRAIQGQYPPGSTFKIAVAIAALAEGAIRPDTRVTCHGAVAFGNRRFRCWRKGGHGTVDVVAALERSCDVFFYQAAQRLGIDTISRYARLLGLGAPTGIELPHEKTGLVPDRDWKRRHFGEPWYPGETLPVGIGQGYLTATPIQIAQMAAMAATGKRFRPHILKRIESPEGKVLRTVEPELIARLDADPSVLARVGTALVRAVNSPQGTGRLAQLPYVDVAGKTGTSQVVRLGKERRRVEETPREERDHAWFVAYAPAEDPRIAVAALIEHADGGGGAVAAPAAREVLESYFLQEERARPRLYAQN